MMTDKKHFSEVTQMLVLVTETLATLKGHTILINQSITRSRDVGRHDRHFAAQAQFRMIVENVDWTFSGGHFYLYGEEDLMYGILLENVRDFDQPEENTLVIAEHFESETERRTVIRRID